MKVYNISRFSAAFGRAVASTGYWLFNPKEDPEKYNAGPHMALYHWQISQCGHVSFVDEGYADSPDGYVSVCESHRRAYARDSYPGTRLKFMLFDLVRCPWAGSTDNHPWYVNTFLPKLAAHKTIAKYLHSLCLPLYRSYSNQTYEEWSAWADWAIAHTRIAAHRMGLPLTVIVSPEAAVRGSPEVLGAFGPDDVLRMMEKPARSGDDVGVWMDPQPALTDRNAAVAARIRARFPMSSWY